MTASKTYSHLASAILFFTTSVISITAEAKDVDTIFAEHWQSKKVALPAIIDDTAFLRRVYLDVIGRIPNHAESTAFLSSTAADKRERLIDQLLKSEGYVRHFMSYWADVLRMKPLPATYTATDPYFNWLRDALRDNKPYDVMVRELLSAQGYVTDNPAIGFWFRDTGMPLDRFALMSRTFLGTRVECAQCHDHPFDKWTQKQFYEMAAFSFSVETGLFNGGNYNALYWNGDERFGVDSRIGKHMGAALNALYEPLFGNHLRLNPGLQLNYPHDYQYDNAKPKEKAGMSVFFGKMPVVDKDKSPQQAFAEWVTDPETPRFGTVIVNRLVQRVFGRALIESFDDLRDTTTASIPALETFLEEQMSAQRYDMRAFLRLLLNSRAYQSAAHPMLQMGQEYHFNGPLTRRLSAEQIWDSLATLVNPEPDRPNLVRLDVERMKQIKIKTIADVVYNLPDKDIWEQLKVHADWIVESQELGLKLAAEREEAQARNDTARVSEIEKQLKARRDQEPERTLQDLFLPLAKQRHGGKVPPQEVLDILYRYTPSNWDRIPPPDDLVAAATRDAKTLKLTDPNKVKNYLNKRREWNASFCRAAEKGQPELPGSLIRNLGQSDRELVENANLQPAIPHVLDLLNDRTLIENLTNPFASLRLGLARAETDEAKLRTLFLTLLVREPAAEEMKRLLPLVATVQGQEDIVLAAINTKDFLHQQ
jgi:hypothetical protein